MAGDSLGLNGYFRLRTTAAQFFVTFFPLEAEPLISLPLALFDGARFSCWRLPLARPSSTFAMPRLLKYREWDDGYALARNGV